MRRVLLGIAVLGVFAAAPAGATERELGGHLFLPSRFVRDPFIATMVSFANTGGVAEVDGPDFNAAGVQIGGRTHQIGSILQATTFEARTLDFLKLRFTLDGGVYSGLNARSALVVGASAFATFAVGAAASWRIGDRLMLGANVDLAGRPSFQLQIVEGLVRALRSGSIDTGGVVTRPDVFAFGGGLVGAFAWTRWLGSTFSLRYERPRIDDGANGDIVRNDLLAGVTLDLDFQRLWEMPIGLLVAYQHNFALDEATLSRLQELSAGIYYTGRTALQLGADVSWRWFDLRSTLVDASAFFASLVIRYYWN